MRPGLAKIFENVHISQYFESLETELHIAENDCCIDYADTWSFKPVDVQSNNKCPCRGTTYSGCENTLEYNSAVA
jgi:hypothetical protein